MIYEWVVDSSTVTEERMQEIAAEEVDCEEMEDALRMLVDEHGFSWLLKQLKEEAFEYERKSLQEVGMYL